MSKYNKYIWLVDTLKRKKYATLKELQDEWSKSKLSYKQPRLDRRTLFRWRAAAEDMFGINIELDTKRHYSYYIAIDTKSQDQAVSWMLQAATVRSITDDFKAAQDRVIFEDVPSGETYLTTLLKAIKSNKQLLISYRNFAREEPNAPAVMNTLCVRMFGRRWYAVVDFAEKEDYRRIISLDRIHSLEELDTTFKFPKDFDAEEYFQGSYGIWVDRSLPVERILLKVKKGKYPYIRTLPLHQSQSFFKRDDDYVYVELQMRITNDVPYALLPHMKDIEILEPLSLKEEIVSIANKIINNNSL